jgi:cell division cycle 2-like protein
MFMELSTKEPLFNGGKEDIQLDNIFKMLGTPETALMERFKRYRDQSKNVQSIVLGEKSYHSRVREVYGRRLPDSGFDLFLRMIEMDPDRRISATDALHHRYFTSSSIPNPSA